jgi:hypothetical protein
LSAVKGDKMNPKRIFDFIMIPILFLLAIVNFMSIEDGFWLPYILGTAAIIAGICLIYRAIKEYREVKLG